MADAYDLAHQQLWREFLHRIAQPECSELLWSVINNAPARDREEFLAGLQQVIATPDRPQRLVRAVTAIVNDHAQLVADRDAYERSLLVDVGLEMAFLSALFKPARSNPWLKDQLKLLFRLVGWERPR